MLKSERPKLRSLCNNIHQQILKWHQLQRPITLIHQRQRAENTEKSYKRYKILLFHFNFFFCNEQFFLQVKSCSYNFSHDSMRS